MALKKILYLTADYVATSAELAEIATLKAIAEAEYELIVACGKPRASLTGVTISADASDNSYNDSGATITASTISAASADQSINDSEDGFLDAGFQVGDAIKVSGFIGDTANNATRIATSVTAGKIIFGGTDGATIVNDSSGTVTASAPGRFLLRGFKVGDHVMVRGFTGHNENNIDDAVVTSVTATKMIIGGTDGDVILDDSAGESVTISTVETGAKYGDVNVVADYLAGTVPEAYKSSGSPVYTEMDPDNPPDPPSLIYTQTILSDEEEIELDTAGTVTVTVEGNAITAADVEATESVVTDADTLTLTTAGTVTFGVTDHVLSGDVAADEAVVQDGATVALGDDDITLGVADHVITPSIGTDKTIVEDGDTVTVDGVPVPLAVTAGALGASTLEFEGSTSKVITNGIEIPATGTISTKVTVTIVNGVITACVGDG